MALTAGVAALLCGFGASAARADDASQIRALRAEIAQLSAQADRIEDANQVKKLQRAYGYYIDRGYWGEAADLFTDDAQYEIGQDGVYIGKDRIHELLVRHGGGNPGPGLPYGQYNHHMQLQPVVHVAPDGLTAKGRWRELMLLGQFQKYARWGDAIAEVEYVKQGGVWKISKVHSYLNFVAPYEGGWTTLKEQTGDGKTPVATAFPPDRPPTSTYKTFPTIYVPPFDYKNPVTGR